MSRLILGQWNCLCDICGFEFKSSELRKNWQGLMVCSEDFEQRNQQDFIRIRPEKVTPPWVRPEPPDVFIHILALTDVVAIVDPGEQNYIDSSYFLEDYLSSNLDFVLSSIRAFTSEITLSDSLGFLQNSSFTDSFGLVDSFVSSIVGSDSISWSDSFSLTDEGTAIQDDYIDATYFSSDYVRTERIFT